MSGHTPGPWNVQRDGQVWCDDHPIVEKMCSGPWGDEAVNFITGEHFLAHHWGTVATDEAKANATLIAASPDLLEALKESAAAMRPLAHYYELNDQRDGNLEVPVRELGNVLKATKRAIAAIAKAEGR